MNGLNSYPVPTAVEKELTPYEKHAFAAKEWQEACHNYRQADARRVAAEKSLAEATQNLAKFVEHCNSDPTVPQCPPPQMPPGNNAFQIGGRQ